MMISILNVEAFFGLGVYKFSLLSSFYYSWGSREQQMFFISLIFKTDERKKTFYSKQRD